jgi:hypothetical protein
MEVIGWVGTALVIIAYYPYIHQLIIERHPWGISVLTRSNNICPYHLLEQQRS